jgi:Na+/H+ antiporter NhaC
MKKGILSLSPLLVFLCLYLVTSIVAHDFYKVPVTVAFLVSAIYAVVITRGTLNERIRIFSEGAGHPDMMLMLWIFLLAGAFAASAKAMGAVDATVNLTLRLLPQSLLLPGLFLAACFISLSIGTSVGTIAALTPVAAGISGQSDCPLPLMVAIVVGGAFFGDNLSFISDTTIVATQTQGCKMSDKFRANLRIVLPVALLMLIIYYVIGLGIHVPTDIPSVDFWKIIPYITVIVTAVCGMNVLYVLVLGLVLTGWIGMIDGSYDLFEWFSAMASGMMGMSELIVMTLLAGGMLSLIRHNGGVQFLIDRLTHGVTSKRNAEFSIASLVCLVNICTANNTVAIITAGPIAADIATRFGIDRRKSASILDTVSCFTQGLLPYGAQMLIAAGLASEAVGLSLSPAAIIGYLYYPMGIGLAVVISILHDARRAKDLH